MEKKNFLFVSLTGLISDIAWQVSKEGHEVRYFIGDKKERDGLQRPSRGRPIIRPGRAEKSRSQHHPLRRIRIK